MKYRETYLIQAILKTKDITSLIISHYSKEKKHYFHTFPSHTKCIFLGKHSHAPEGGKCLVQKTFI